MEEELLISQKEEIIKSFLDDNEEDISSLESDILNIILSIIYKINIDDKLKFNLSSYNSIGELDTKVDKVLRKSKFYKNLKNINKIFKELIDTNTIVHKSLSNINIDKISYDKLLKVFYDRYKSYFDVNSLFKNIIYDIKEFLFNNLVSNTNTDEVIKGVKAIYNDLDIVSEIKNFIVDTYYSFDGAIQATVINNYKMKYVLYVLSPNAPIFNKKGKLIDSRPQCKRWTGMQKIAIKDLENEIEWAYSNGKGMIPSTTIDNFYINRGGYNCRHIAIPLKN